MNISEIAKLLDLPCYETVFEVLQERFFNRALRKLRHPSRAKKLKDYLFDGYCANRKLCERVYYMCQVDITEQISENLKQGKSVYEALKSYYGDSIASFVAKSPILWNEIPDIGIENMNLSWQLRLIMKRCGMSTLKDIVTAHGTEGSLQSVDESKLPFEKKYVVEILMKIQEYCPDRIEIGNSDFSESIDLNDDLDIVDTQTAYYQKIKKIVEIAERTLLRDSEKPTLPFDYMRYDVARALVGLMYRHVEQLASDYESGILKERLLQKFSDNAFVNRVIVNVEQIVNGKYEAHAFYFEMPDGISACEKDPMFIQKMRRAYFRDEQLTDSGINLEEHAHDIFPMDHLPFNLVRETRAGERFWRRINQEDMLLQITEALVPDSEIAVEKVYVSRPLNMAGKDNLLICVNNDTSKDYLLFGVYYIRDDNKFEFSNAERYMLSHEQGASLEECITFVEELEQTTSDFVLDAIKI